MLSTDDHSNYFRGRQEGIIADHTQVDEDMTNMNTDEDSETTAVRAAAAATEVEAMAKAAYPTQHQLSRAANAHVR